MKFKLVPIALGLAGLLAIDLAVNPPSFVSPHPSATPPGPSPASGGRSSRDPLSLSAPGPTYAFRQATDLDTTVPLPATHLAENAAYQLQIRCEPTGITLTPSAPDPSPFPAWSFTLAHAPSQPAEIRVDGAKATYQHRPDRQEWFVNSEKGIEHGMTLAAPPTSAEQPLQLEFAVASTLRGEQVEDNRLLFKNAEGSPVLRYEKLFAFDARGRGIPTALSWNAASSTIGWRIDHQGFDYPITIDPVIATFAQTIVTPVATSTSFGDAIAIVGDFMAVGAPSSGRVYLYEKNAGSWVLFSRKNFLVSPATNGGAFGTQVIMPDLDTVIVSDTSFDAPTATGGTNANQGAIFVFGRNVGGDNNWGLVRQFTATDFQLPNGGLADRLGAVMAYDNGTLAAVAIPDQDSYDTAIKFLYLFEKDRGGANNWGQIPGVRVQGLNFSSGFTYGNTFDLSGDLLVVGSSAENYQAGAGSPIVQFQGAIYLYGRNQGGANQWGLLPNGRRYAPDGAFGDFFGRSVSISGDWIAVGADSVDLSASQNDAGAVYLLSRNQGGTDAWGIVPGRLTAADAAAGDSFGAFVTLLGDVLAVRASSDDVAGSNNVGSVYLFERQTGGAFPFAAVSNGKFSIDNVSNIVKVNSPLFLSPAHLAFATDPNVGNSSLSLLNLSGVTAPAGLGRIRFTPQGVVDFVPSAAGTYQLRTSTNLTTWVDFGAPQAGAANVSLTWNTGAPGAEAKRFYRVETP